MNNYLKKNFCLISFIFIPILYLADINLLSILGSQPYWPLFWLLPWSMIHGSVNGSIVGLFLGLILDSIVSESSFTQIPGLVLCGIWFGRFSTCNNIVVGHLRYGLLCSIGSFLCGTIYFFQILIKNLPDYSLFFYFPSIKNILIQVLLTGIFAPLFCSRLLGLFKSTKQRRFLISLRRK